MSKHQGAWSRIYIFGNAGSGKSWLAGRLAPLLNQPVHNLDALRWQQDGSGTARNNLDVANEVADLSLAPSWIMEGVYGWLAQVALPRATSLIWTDLPLEDCVANVTARGPQGGEDREGFLKTVAWAEEYFIRQSSSCYSAHEKLFHGFAGTTVRLRSRSDIAECLAMIEADQSVISASKTQP